MRFTEPQNEKKVGGDGGAGGGEEKERIPKARKVGTLRGQPSVNVVNLRLDRK